ncbi:MAG TPA: endonuclease/exonuclease/phosphatase family protein [Kofleriaceae bacterium]|nr:endonuclease/exonuclease/phosphatase family protein [Kofleriaceae bacterium]
MGVSALAPAMVLMAAAVAAASAGCARGGESRPPAADAHGKTLTVMSYNVNFGLEGDASGIEAIRTGGADLVVLQETTAGWERAIRAELRDAYPHMQFRHCCLAGGLAFLSKHPLAEREYVGPAEGGWFPAWRVIVSAPFGDVQVLAVHLHPPLDEKGSVVSGYFPSKRVRRREIEAFAPLLDKDPTLPALVIGDFNEDERGLALRFLAGRGLVTVLPSFQPDADTWQWQTSLGPVKSRLDHVVADPRLVALDARVINAGRSDHFPVVATFRRAATTD